MPLRLDGLDLTACIRGTLAQSAWDLYNHSPGGFEWSYAGSGPAQLSLALLASATDNDQLALRLHQRFKFERIATLRRNQDWTMTQEAVLAFVRANMGEVD